MAPAQDTLTAEARPQPGGGLPSGVHLVLALEGERPMATPVAVSLQGVEVVELGRGDAREIRRDSEGRRVTIALPDPRVSTAHARLTAEADGWVAIDLGSKNGSFLNGARVLRGRLAPGDTFRVGEVLFVVTAAGAAPRLDGTADGPVEALESFAPAMAAISASLARIALGDVAVLVHGETGVGKEVIANALHELSGRRGRFVAVNCAALPENLFEAELFGYRKGAFSGATAAHDGLMRAASGGTLLLDEIGELRPASQAALLRALEQREVVPVGETTPVRIDVRVIAATNVELEDAVRADRFRRDLLARLAGFVVRVPPLRARKEDLGLLVRALIGRVAPETAERLRFGVGVVAALAAHAWPDNVRELRNALHGASLLAFDGVVTVEMLPPAVRAPPAVVPAKRDERAELRAKLEALLGTHAGNLAAVARELGKDRKQIRRWLEMFDLDVERYRPH
jgi:DNA-binding NtrC family response regulator